MDKSSSPFTILFLGRIANTALSALVHETPEGKTYKDAITVPDGVNVVPAWRLTDGEDVPAGTIAYHPILGEICYGHSWWRFSTKDFLDDLKAAEENPSIVAHILHIDSCGGEAFGMHEAFEAVRDLTKPCYAIIESMAASGGYYLACAADRIYASSLFSEIGCIGTMCTMINDEKWMEQHGYKELEFYSNYSPLKNKVFRDALEGNGEEFVKRFLDPLALQFITDVRSVRKNVAEDSDAIKGETFYSTDAQPQGLIDGVMSFQDVVDELVKLTTPKEPSININQINFSK